MNWITKLVIKIGWTKINNSKIEKWIIERNKELLLFTLQNALYRERIQAIQGLKRLKDKSIIPELLKISRNDYEVVAKEAIKAIKEIDDNRPEYKEEIEELERYWEIKNHKTKIERTNGMDTWANKKSKMKNLERLKQRLKRPLYGGKWL